MGVKLGTYFNRAVVSLMNENAAPVSQILQVRLQADRPKIITGIHCSYIKQSNITGGFPTPEAGIADTFVQGRVAVIIGTLNLEGLSANDLLGNFNPFQAVILADTPGANLPIAYDRSFINTLDADFERRIIISGDQDVNIIMSQGYTPSDSGILVSTTKVGSLNVIGYYGDIDRGKTFRN